MEAHETNETGKIIQKILSKNRLYQGKSHSKKYQLNPELLSLPHRLLCCVVGFNFHQNRLKNQLVRTGTVSRLSKVDE